MKDLPCDVFQLRHLESLEPQLALMLKQVLSQELKDKDHVLPEGKTVQDPHDPRTVRGVIFLDGG